MSIDRAAKVFEDGGWHQETEPTPALVRQVINNGEIGGEMHDAVLMEKLQRMFNIPPLEAALAVDEAHVAGYIKPGFWDRRNWSPVSDAARNPRSGS